MIPPSRPIVGETLGARIRAAIEWSGVSKAAVSRACGVAWPTVNNWVKDAHEPEIANLRSLAEVTRVTIDEILGVAAGQDPPFASWDAFMATREGEAMTPSERRGLQCMVWPAGTEPTVASYQIALASLRSTIPRVA